MSHLHGRDSYDDNDYDDLYWDRKASNGDYGHHENNYHDDNCCGDARIMNPDDDKDYPNGVVDLHLTR